MVTPGPLGARLTAAAAAARAPWLLFLRPGCVPETGWVDEAGHYLRETEPAGIQDMRAAVFRNRPSHARSALGEALALLASALGAPPKPSQGLLILKEHYERVGGHDAARMDPETALLGTLGRRIVVLRSGVTTVGAQR
jgi:hypothetical protein